MSKYILTKSTRSNKKYMLITPDNKKIHFGAIKENGKQYSDFTKHKDEERKKRYINRHKKRENKFWSHNKKNLLTPSYLSRFILWEKPNLNDAVKYIENKQNIKIINNI